MEELERALEPKVQEETEIVTVCDPEAGVDNTSEQQENLVPEGTEEFAEAPEKKGSPKKLAILCAASTLIIGLILFAVYGLPAIRYSGAVKAFNSADYVRAVKVFSDLKGYKESEAYLEQAELGVHYNTACIKAEAGEYSEAIEEYKKAENFRDAAELLQQTYVLYGDSLLSQKKYEEAIQVYKNIRERKLSKDRLQEAYVLYGDDLLSQGKYEEAIHEYGHGEASDKIAKAYDLMGEALFREEKYAQAAEAFASGDNRDRQLDCAIALVEQEKDYAAALTVLENNTSDKAEPYRNYANGVLSMESGDYQAAVDYFANCSGLLDASERQNASAFLMAEKCLHEGYLNKAKTLYSSLPEGYTQDGVAAADRIALLNSNQKFLDLVGSWRATDTYFRVQADSTTSSYYYYWYQDSLKLGNVTVTCPYNDDGTFSVKGTATFPTYTNFSSRSSELDMELKSFNFSKVCGASIPRQVGSSSTTKLNFSGRQFDLQYKFVNDYSNVFWSYTFTSKVKYGTRNMLPEDR